MPSTFPSNHNSLYIEENYKLAMKDDYVYPFNEFEKNFKKNAKKTIKKVNGIPYICYEIKQGSWGSCGEVDPKYKPEIPEGALPGDVSKQKFCMQHHKPKFYYVDASFKCKACGKDTVFSASEKKYWFEELHFHFDSFPKECKECRIKLRNGKLKKIRSDNYKEIEE